jgi:carbon-monoxide dehydrogenase medium subunit
MRPFEILDPGTVAEASGLLRQHGDAAKIIAGGTAVTLLLKEGLLSPGYLISTARLPEMDFLRAGPGGLEVGAGVTLRALERSPLVREGFPALAQALAAIGNVRIRHAATLGGHLAHADPRLDLPPVLITLGARARCQRDGEAREVPVADLFLGPYETCLAPDELVTGINVPSVPARAASAFLRYTPSSPTDWPLVNVAVLLGLDVAGRCDRLEIGIGCVAGRALRVTGRETGLLGERLTASALRALAEGSAARAEPVSDLRGSVDYKREMVKVFVRRAVAQAARALGREVA